MKLVRLDGAGLLMGSFPHDNCVQGGQECLTIRGLVDGEHYIVREQPDGWLVVPEKKHRVRKTGMSAEAFARLYRARAFGRRHGLRDSRQSGRH